MSSSGETTHKKKKKGSGKQLTLGNFFGSTKTAAAAPSKTKTKKAPPAATTAKGNQKPNKKTTRTETSAYASQAQQLDPVRLSEIATICLGTSQNKKQPSKSSSMEEATTTPHPQNSSGVRLFPEAGVDSAAATSKEDEEEDTTAAVVDDSSSNDKNHHHINNAGEEEEDATMMNEVENDEGREDEEEDAETVVVDGEEDAEDDRNGAAKTPADETAATTLDHDVMETDKEEEEKDAADDSCDDGVKLWEKNAKTPVAESQKDKAATPNDDASSTEEDAESETGDIDDDEQPQQQSEASIQTPAAAASTNASSKGKKATGKTPNNSAATTATKKKNKTKAMPAAVMVFDPSSVDWATLPPAAQQLLPKHAALRETYVARAQELLERVRAGIDVKVDMPVVTEPVPDAYLPTQETDSSAAFPDFALRTLAALVEGRSEPLPELVASVVPALHRIYPNVVRDTVFDSDAVTAKIKLLATRKRHIKQPNIVVGVADADAAGAATTNTTTTTNPLNVFEDDNPDHLWRWEVAVLDLLPAPVLPSVKKARAACKKMGTHFAAVTKLLLTLQEADQQLLQLSTTVDANAATSDATAKDPSKASSPSSSSSSSFPPKLDKLLARLSQEEEKVLKYEREAEKQRLAAEAKAAKEAAKRADEQRKADQERQKQQAALAKQRQKEEAVQAKQRHKDEIAAAKERKQQAEAKERAKKEAATEKQQKLMNSFFAPKSKKKSASETAKPAAVLSATNAKSVPVAAAAAKASDTVATVSAVAEESSDTAGLPYSEFTNNNAVAATTTTTSRSSSSSFDVEAFRASLFQGSSAITSPPFCSLSKPARQSRRRRTRNVTIPVTVTVYPDGGEHNPFGAQPYAEQQDLVVPNKYKFLSFHEDVRPPYYGTWSHRSAIVTGSKPFAKDTTSGILDYDVDSEAEWEEGDDEIGEDIGDDDDNDEDDEMLRDDDDDDDDGWLAGEVDEELDEETKLLRQKQLGSDNNTDNNNSSNNNNKTESLKVCVIAPGLGGKPCVITPDSNKQQQIEGYDPIEAERVLDSLTAITVHKFDLFLDAFPPSEDTVAADASQQDAKKPASASDNKSGGGSSTQTKLSDENMRIFARFVHNSQLASKAMVVDELLQTHKTVTSSRAQALRVLDSMAEKKKNPTGIVWQVKKDVLDSLGLSELAETKCDAKQEAMKKIALFVHNSTTSSKDKIVDDLRAHDESLTASRAEATRILLQMAEKKKHPVLAGHYWQVKPQVLEELELSDVLSSDPPSPAGIDCAKKKTPPPAAKSHNADEKADSSSSATKKKSSGKKRAALGSVKLLEGFVKVKKKKTP